MVVICGCSVRSSAGRKVRGEFVLNLKCIGFAAYIEAVCINELVRILVSISMTEHISIDCLLYVYLKLTQVKHE